MEAKKKPVYVSDLENVFGPPSQEAFGGAVFFETEKAIEIEQAALERYRYFVGDLWEQYGEEAWMGPWKEVYVRAPGAPADIVAEIKGLQDQDAKFSIPLLLEAGQDPEAMQKALSSAFDDPTVTELRVFNIGDGEAMSGLLVAGFRKKSKQATFVIVLMD